VFTTNDQNLVIDMIDKRPVAVFVDSHVAALGQDAQSETVILRLSHLDWPKDGPGVPRDQVHQFALNAHRAAELGHRLLALAAQAQKDRHPNRPAH
jgi:hypothetical protein